VVFSLQEAVSGIFGRLSDSQTDLCLTYRPAAPPEPEAFLSTLRARRREDLARGSTQAGPHRDELELLLDGRSLQRYGSQGQHRSAALALRLAEARVMGESAEEAALVLLDDCLSELDVGRGQRLLEILGGYRQVFMTTTAPPPNLSDCAGVFRVVAGSLEEA
jgi:DNA replication and repair protein RecF